MEHPYLSTIPANDNAFPRDNTRIAEILNTLPEINQRIMRLHLATGFSPLEIATTLAMSEAEVTRLIAESIKQLRSAVTNLPI